MPVKKIAIALREVKKSVRNIMLFNSLIDSLVVMILLTLGCTLLSFPWWYALLPALVYTIVHLHGNLKQVTFKNIEAKFPELEEELITAADNWRKDNEIVDALCKDVLAKMKHVNTSTFLDFGKLTREIAVMTIVAFIIIGSSAFNVKFFDFAETIKDLKEFRPFQEQYDINEELLMLEEGQNLSDILGEESVAILGQQQLDVEINPIKSEVDIGKVSDPTEQRFNSVPPAEIRATSDSGFEDSIPKEYQRIVKTYFKEITRS